MGFKEWAHKRMTKGAIAARERGDTVYIKQLHNVQPAIVARWVMKIEGEGWKLEHQQQTQGPGMSKAQLRWTLTFRRVETTGELPGE